MVVGSHVVVNRCYWMPGDSHVVESWCYWMVVGSHVVLNWCYWMVVGSYLVVNWCYWMVVGSHMVVNWCYWMAGDSHVVENWCYWMVVDSHVVLNWCYWMPGDSHVVVNWCYWMVVGSHVVSGLCCARSCRASLSAMLTTQCVATSRDHITCQCHVCHCSELVTPNMYCWADYHEIYEIYWQRIMSAKQSGCRGTCRSDDVITRCTDVVDVTVHSGFDDLSRDSCLGIYLLTEN